jgi:hypothetical protein
MAKSSIKFFNFMTLSFAPRQFIEICENLWNLWLKKYVKYPFSKSSFVILLIFEFIILVVTATLALGIEWSSF